MSKQLSRTTVERRHRLTPYNTIAFPIAAGLFYPAFGFVLRPEIAALSMSGSSLIVAVNALLLKRLRLPRAPSEEKTATTAAEHTVSA